MRTFAAITALSILAALPLRSPAEQSEPGYAWDCPGTGRLPYRAAMLVEPDWLQSRLHEPGLVILHVEPDPDPDAPRDRYGDGHVPGALLLRAEDLSAPPGAPTGALPSLERRLLAVRLLGIRGDERLVLYDAGRGFEAARAFLVLDSIGLSANAALLNGQWAQWRDEGRPRTTSIPAPEPSFFEPRSLRTSVASRVSTRDYLWGSHQDPPSAAILDVRSAREPLASPEGPDFVPGSIRLPWEAFTACGAFARLPGEERLRRAFRPAAPFPDRPVLVIGGDPGEAAFGWFTARLLGYPARASEETFEEWSAGVNPREWSDPELHGLSPQSRR